MATHYVYEEPNRASLCQGDILKRTAELTELLRGVHPHYAEHKSYRYFLVLTQTCDLVRRDGNPCSSPYITIAAVRPVEEAIRREARKYQEWWQEPVKVVDGKTFNQLLLFTESLLDNNVPNYFYLHEDLTVDISGQNCAFLALSIALRSEHYDLCLRAKTAQLKEPFRAKLGWLVGNMYSRIGTQEWNEHYGQDNVRRTASDLLGDLFVNIPAEKVRDGIAELTKTKSLKEFSPDEIYAHVEKKKIIPRSTQFAARAEEILRAYRLIDSVFGPTKAALGKDNPVWQRIIEITRDPGEAPQEEIANSVRREVFGALGAVSSDDVFPNRDKLITRLVAALRDDAQIRAILR